MTDPELSLLLSKYTPHELSMIVHDYEREKARRKEYQREYMRRYRSKKAREQAAAEGDE